MSLDRRTFLQMLSAGATAGAVPRSIAKALSIPANNKTGTLQDLEHIVILMQENRSFDHYFGTLRGVRGFGDPRAVKLPGGLSVFQQPDDIGGYIAPFHPNAPDLGLQFLEDLAHDWTTTHLAWNQGWHNQWVAAKTYLSMAHLQRTDIPYHYALADAFTICDAYHASLLGPTDPNRYHLFSGWVGNDGQGGGPVIDNAEAGYGWKTFPEILEKAGITWKVYQDVGEGLTAAGGWGNTQNPYIGNYGDNALLYFTTYQNAAPGSALFEKARTGTNVAAGGTLFDLLRQDVADGTVPQVSYLIAPEAYSEHPNWPANYGAYYVSQVLDTLTSNPSLWSKTALFITYDENDGFFDHVVPPTPPSSAGLSNVSTANETYAGSTGNPSGPYGLGLRVPMLVVSPWSKGGWVNSEVFDHTSLIRFIQRRFGTVAAPLTDTNVTAWRQAVCGDLTSAFNFASPNAAPVPLPGTAAYAPPDDQRHASYIPVPPLVQSIPVQESGSRPARAVPYAPNVSALIDAAAAQVTLTLANAGRSACVLQARSAYLLQPPRSYTIAGGTQLNDVWTFGPLALDRYDLSIHGPNGFLRSYRGGLLQKISAVLSSGLAYDAAQGSVTLSIANRSTTMRSVQVTNGYGGDALTINLKAGATLARSFSLGGQAGWYDFVLLVDDDPTFRQQLAGHLETGRDSTTDPHIGTR